MQRHSSLLILLVLLLFTTSSTAQPYILQHLSIGDGLSNNYVQDIAQDKRGCIWIATVLGLNRFDGLKFTTYKSTNSKLGNDALNTLLYNEEDDELWVGSNNGLYILDCSTEQFRQCTPPEDISINNISDLAPASNGGIWIVSHTGQIVHYNKEDEKYTSLSNQIKGKLKQSSWCAFDNYKVAIEWVDKSLSLFEKRVDSNASDITALRDYRRQLMERKSDNSLLQKQM